MLKLHFAPNSRAVRTLWLLEELGLDYELNRMDFHPKDLKSDEHRARHPLGRIPFWKMATSPFGSPVRLPNIFWSAIKMAV